MEWKFKKNEKWNKVILVVLCGILLLVIVMPQKTVQTAVGQTGSSSDTTASYSASAGAACGYLRCGHG